MPLVPKTLSVPRLLMLLGAVAAAPGCSEGCLSGDESCQVPSPCQALRFTCAADDPLELRVLDGRSPAGGSAAIGARGDVLIGNGQVVAVIAGLGDQNLLDPNGGSILDIGVRGKDNDGVNQILHIVGILPRDAANYTKIEQIRQPGLVAVQLRGTLFQYPGVQISTRYEVRPCEPGVRVRTEIHNGTPDPQLWHLSDGFYWSGREMLPFTPDAGFQHPSFDLLSINDALKPAPFMAASTHAAPDESLAVTGCTDAALEGFQSAGVSSLGLRRAVVAPRSNQVYERFLSVKPSGDIAGAADVAQAVRAQLGGDALVTLRGQVDRGGLPLGTERLASILISQGTLQTPAAQRLARTQVVPDATGRFSAAVPTGRDYVLEFHSLGRKLAEKEVRAGQSPDLGTTQLGSTARLTVTVKEAGAPLLAEVFLVPADAATAAGSQGSVFGQFDACAPWLGPPPGGSPACNRALVPAAGTTVEVAPGVYYAYAYHGPFYTIARQRVDLTAGDAQADLTLARLSLMPPKALSADLHVHGAASFDSSIPEEDRVLSFAAADVGVIIATDHDVVHDYAPVVQRLGLSDRVSTVTGVETTGHIPFMKIPTSDFPLVIGHYNFWPLKYQPDLPRAGGPFDELIEPGRLFDRVDPLYSISKDSAIAQLNHPWAEPEFGRDLGFPRALGLNLLQDLPAQADGTAQGMYRQVPAGGLHRNNDHQTQEVMNGTINDTLPQYRAFWFYLLNQGELHTGTANSDSHSLVDSSLGSPRNVVFTDTRPGPGFDVVVFNQALRSGLSLGTNGPIIGATIRDVDGVDQSFGLRPIRPAPGASLQIDVSAAPWVPVEEIRVIVNGRVAKTISGAALQRPADPLGATGTLRYRGAVPLSEVLPQAGDAWIVVEAGWPLPLFADLGGGTNNALDGVPDTGDNNGDGKVDAADIAAGKKVGPLNTLPMPTDENDRRFHFAQVVPASYPFAFTNPFLLDRDGNGRFDAPRTKGGTP